MNSINTNNTTTNNNNKHHAALGITHIGHSMRLFMISGINYWSRLELEAVLAAVSVRVWCWPPALLCATCQTALNERVTRICLPLRSLHSQKEQTVRCAPLHELRSISMYMSPI